MSPISSAEFKKLLAIYFSPKLKASGWIGTGFHYLNFHNPPYIYVLGFQPDKYGKRICVEIGIHFNFIQLGYLKDFKKLRHSHLDIRKRLTPNNESDFWWEYSNNEIENIDVINTILKTFYSSGLDFFKQFQSYPGLLSEISVDEIINMKSNRIQGIPMPTVTRSALIFAQINQNLGRNSIAKEFADFGLSTIVGPNGAALIPVFEEIKKNVSKSE